MKTMATVCFLLVVQCSFGQFLQDVNGKPYLQKTLNDYEGSPLLFGNWVKANVRSSGGTLYKDMLVNIDVVQNLPIFFRDDNVYTFSDPIDELIVGEGANEVMVKRGKAIRADLPDAFFEIIHASPLLLKRTDKNAVEMPSYGSSSKTYRYAEVKTYYVLGNNDIQKTTLTKENAQKVFTAHWQAAEAYAKKNNLSYKTEAGWRQLADYVKTLNP